ncbi:hypothetical protein EHR02_16585 [Leptospira levettii]|uniref:hypothetical protein n=1 Tax=Leptospira levettii TaxID=2023178 RepID=UPI001082AC52|nr:hypothetical protein [Leptospira levettii]TGM89025.1 hypothetical protein EHR02_16585 [Leptospira levettii]
MNILDEIKNSMNAIIAERSVSPLFGSMLVSWLTWNWKILYILFGNGDYSDYEDRLEFIEIYHSDKTNLIVYPLLSTIFVLLIYPILSISAYWLWLKFDILKKKIRNDTERNELLTLEESVQIKIEMQKAKDFATNLITEKEREIDHLKNQLEIQISNSLNKEKNEKNKSTTNLTSEKSKLKDKIKSNKKLTDALNYIFESHKKKLRFNEMKNNISEDTFEFFKTNKIISEGFNGEIEFNFLGEEMYKEFLNNLFS